MSNPPQCPKCGQPAPDGTYPPSSEWDDGENVEPEPWWCRKCLHDKAFAAYAAAMLGIK